MKKFVIATVVAIVIILSACRGSDDKKTTKIIEEPLSAFNSYQGTWIRKGTGDIWVIGDEKLTTYSFNNFGCIRDKAIELSQIEAVVKHLSLNDEKTQFTLDDLASNKALYSAIGQLPDSCNVANLLTQIDLPTNFEFLWHTMNDYYAFFELRDIDWQGVYDEYRPQITSATTEDEFFAIVESIFSKFGDGHLSLSDGDDREASGAALTGFILEVARNFNGDGDFGKALHDLKIYNEQILLGLLQDEKLHSYQESDAIRWGKVSDDIGYVRIDRLQDISAKGEQQEAGSFLEQLTLVAQDLIDTDTVMQAALSDVGNSEALIIDLRFNSGGYDNVALNIASYFSNVAQTIGSKRIINKNFVSANVQLNLATSPLVAYSKPVYVITGRSTTSGGEVLSMALKALPQVKLIGETTNGSVSDSLEHSLPNGWKLTLSHEVYSDGDGTKVESIGVKPDVEMPVYSSKDLAFFSNTPIDYVLQTFGTVTHSIPTAAVVDATFEEYFKPTNIPGIAVAIIRNDRIVYQKAYGFANIAQETPVTMDTPFNVASISKTVLATGIMQKVEQGEISLTDKLTEMNLSFDPNNPLNQDDGMTLGHLVTHTSGIRDSKGYACSHFVHENGASLSQVLGRTGCPENATIDSTTFFANDYFNENGRYVMDGVYSDGEEGLPGVALRYSNVATGLAGYAVEQKLNIDFLDSMKATIFMPLKMNNTSWRHTELSAANPKATQYMLNEDLALIEVPEYSYPTVYEGDLNASANDIAKFLITIMNGGEYQGNRILNQATVASMLSPQTAVFSQRDVQGVFWYWSGAFVGHYGGDPGTSTIMQYNATTKTGIVVLMNGEDIIAGKGELSQQLSPLMSAFYRHGLGQ